MVKHTCSYCDFETDRKSTYDLHLVSNKHIKKVNTASSKKATVVEDNQSISSIEEPTATNIECNTRIIQLEYELKMKEKEIERIINEYTLKLQMKDLEIKHKDEIIEFLQNKPKEEPNNIQLLVQEKPKLAVVDENVSQLSNEEDKKLKLPIKQCLLQYRADAPSFENCTREFFCDANYNKFINVVDFIGEYKILKEEFIKQGGNQADCISAVEEILKSYFRQYEKNKQPFYCSDSKRHILYIKTNDGWIKPTDDNEAQFDKYILNFARCALYSVQRIIHNTYELFKDKQQDFKRIYQLHFSDWIKDHKNEISGVYSIYDTDDECIRKMIKNTKIILSKLSASF